LRVGDGEGGCESERGLIWKVDGGVEIPPLAPHYVLFIHSDCKMKVLRKYEMYTANTVLPQFSLAFFVLLDAAVWSHSAKNGSTIHITFIDWLPLIFSSLGMLIINSIEKTRLSADSFSYSGSGVAWKARVVLFLGFASLAGGMAGGVTVLVLKYVVPSAPWPTMYMGVANLVANGLVMLR